MARQQVKVEMVNMKSWEDVDLALKSIAVNKAGIDKDTAEYNRREQELRQKLTEKHAPILIEIQKLELGIEDYCKQHREEFGKKKTKELNHGSVGFRIHPPAVVKLKGFTWEAVLKLVKNTAEWATQFVVTKEALNKEVILATKASEQITDKELMQMGMTIEQDESFGYEIKNAVEAK